MSGPDKGAPNPLVGSPASRADDERALFPSDPRVDDDDGGFGGKSSYSPVPQVIGDYQVVSRLGGGSMADLYLAKKISTFGFVHRAVIKQVKRSRSDYKQLQRMLLDEARATACFDHPNLIRMFDVGETDSGIFVALEYIEGTDLRRVNAKLRQRKEALPFELACFVVSEVLRGLHHAHAATGPDGSPLDIVHRDVNPSNVLIATSGHVKLTDFGVVRMRERIQQKTEPGLVKGKYAYLAPEYIAGEPCSVQTDLYAAGIMLFELLSGRECFAGNTAYEVMWKIVNKGVPMYRLNREGVPEDLQRIVQRATAMVPERRYATAQDFANALEAWLMRSGRHATPWVLSVFFNRHELFPSGTEPAPPLRPLQRSVPAQVPKPVMQPELHEQQRIQSQVQPAAQARQVDDTLTPAPELAFSFPGDFDVPILDPSDARRAQSSVPVPEPAPPRARQPTEVPEIVSNSPFEHIGSETPTPRAGSTPPSIATPPPPPKVPTSDLATPAAGAHFSIPDDEVTLPNQPLPTKATPPDPRREPTPARLPAERASSEGPRKIVNEDSGAKPKKPAPAPLDPSAPLSEGKLEQLPAAEVLARLTKEGKTGVVEFRCGLIWKRVTLVDGTPTGITSNMGMELIGEHLVKAKIIRRADLERALKASEREGRPLTMKLIENGALDRPTLEEELGKNLAGRLQEVLEWRWGTFSYKDQGLDRPEILPKLDLQSLLTRARAARGADGANGDGGNGEASSPQEKLQEALRVARSISQSGGKGRVDRPWRSTKG